VPNYTGGTVGEYNATTGAAINANFITRLNLPIALTVTTDLLFAEILLTQLTLICYH